MTTERDSRTRTVLSWLRDDAHENAERVLLRALDEVDTTPQRRSWWPAWRFDPMNRLTLAAGAAAAIVLAVVGYNLLPTSTLGPGTTSAPTSSLVAGPPLMHDGPLQPGSYVMFPYPSPNASFRVTVTVPDGWRGFAPGAVVPEAFTEPPDGAAVAFLLPTALYVDPCKANEPGSPTISAGTTVDDLVDAFLAVAGGRAESLYHVGTPTDVVVAGFAGKQLEVIAPSNLDFATCQGGLYWIFDTAPYVQGPGNRWSLSILDVAGLRAVILSHDYATTPLLVRQQARAIVDSLVIRP